CIRLRLRCGYRTDVVEVPSADTLLGSAPDCGVIIANAAPQQAWLLPRRGQLLLAPVANATRRPAVDGVRVEAPVVLAPGQAFQLGDVEVCATRVESAPTLGTMVGPWRLDRDVGADGVAPNIYLASKPDGFACVFRVCHRDIASEADWAPRAVDRVAAQAFESGDFWWSVPGPPGFTLDTLMAAHQQGAIVWPAEAAVVLVTQMAEALCAYHDALGPHGALRPELLFVDREGRISLVYPGPGATDWDYQPESVRLGGLPSKTTDLYGWWRLTRWLMLRFPQLAAQAAIWARAPETRGELLAAAESLRRWAIDAGHDPSAMHVARGVRLALQVSPLGVRGRAE
ncbi:MAG: FHA domain-containing protein, partial [Myxococcota bacterium]